MVKARQIGLTTVETAWDAYVALTRPNAQVAIFSRGDAAATDALRRVEFGLRNVPAWAEVAIARSTEHVLELSAGLDDLRRIQAFPADVHTGRSRTNTHTTVDEWAAVESPQEFWVSIEPSCAGSVHILTTGGSPASYPAEFLRRSQAGATGFSVFFADRYSRPGRDSAWEQATRASMPADHFRREYPATIEDAFSGSGKNRFDSADVDEAIELSLGPQQPKQGHKYVCAWDIGRKHDASVGVVLDCTNPELIDLVAWEYLSDTDFPSLQAVMKGLHNRYGAVTVVEVTGLGIGAFEKRRYPREGADRLAHDATLQARGARPVAGADREPATHDPGGVHPTRVRAASLRVVPERIPCRVDLSADRVLGHANRQTSLQGSHPVARGVMADGSYWGRPRWVPVPAPGVRVRPVPGVGEPSSSRGPPTRPVSRYPSLVPRR